MRLGRSLAGLAILCLPALSLAEDSSAPSPEPTPSTTPASHGITIDIQKLADEILQNVECSDNFKAFKKKLMRREAGALDPLRSLARMKLLQREALGQLHKEIQQRLADCKATMPTPTPAPHDGDGTGEDHPSTGENHPNNKHPNDNHPPTGGDQPGSGDNSQPPSPTGDGDHPSTDGDHPPLPGGTR